MRGASQSPQRRPDLGVLRAFSDCADSAGEEPRTIRLFARPTRVASQNAAFRTASLGGGGPVAIAFNTGRSSSDGRRRDHRDSAASGGAGLWADTTESTVALPQRSHRDGSALLLVGRRRLCTLAAAGPRNCTLIAFYASDPRRAILAIESS